MTSHINLKTSFLNITKNLKDLLNSLWIPLQMTNHYSPEQLFVFFFALQFLLSNFSIMSLQIGLNGIFELQII
jgi:hypothetical protein